MDREHVQIHQNIITFCPLYLSLSSGPLSFGKAIIIILLFYLNCAHCYVRRVKEGILYPSGTDSATIFIRKGKAVPLQTWSGPHGSRKLRFPDFMTTAQDGGKFVSLMHRPPLPPGNTIGTRFCQRMSRTQGHSATGRIMSLKNPNDTIGNLTHDLPVCSVVP